MKIYEIYFSPTGGTKKVTDVLANEWTDEIMTVDLTDSKTNFEKFVPFSTTDEYFQCRTMEKLIRFVSGDRQYI